jgi:predicted DsbA family dithiol-disulfide isomerase
VKNCVFVVDTIFSGRLAMSKPDSDDTIFIDYYSDVLCIWAWIAQARLEELERQWNGKISIRHRYIDVFGDSHNKISRKWGALDGFEKYASHVFESAEKFEHCVVHPDTWNKVRPRSSMQSHLFLKAAGLVAGEDTVAALALRIRQAFFVETRDVSELDALMELARQNSLNCDALRKALRNGEAMAALSTDLQDAAALAVRGSPTWVLNEGRQLLYGNVGYRILNANIDELLKHPGAEASWC